MAHAKNKGVRPYARRKLTIFLARRMEVRGSMTRVYIRYVRLHPAIREMGVKATSTRSILVMLGKENMALAPLSNPLKSTHVGGMLEYKNMTQGKPFNWRRETYVAPVV